MLPRKLVEHFFRLLPVLILPVLITPLLIFAFLSNDPSRYAATATVWASDPAGIEDTGLDSFGGRFQSPSARLETVLTDLLATESFRRQVAIEAGMVDAAASERELAASARRVGRTVHTRTQGTFLVSIDATTQSPVLSQALPTAVTTVYGTRNDEEARRQFELATGYYTEQLVLAQSELDDRQAALTSFVEQNPGVDNEDVSGAVQSQYEILDRGVVVQATLVEDLRQTLQNSYRGAATNELGQEARFTLQDLPIFPDGPLPTTATKAYGYPFAGLLLGLTVSASYLYITFRTDHTIRSTEDLAGIGVPLLGVIPAVSQYDHWPLHKRLQRRQSDFARSVASSIGVALTRRGRA